MELGLGLGVGLGVGLRLGLGLEVGLGLGLGLATGMAPMFTCAAVVEATVSIAEVDRLHRTRAVVEVVHLDRQTDRQMDG